MAYVDYFNENKCTVGSYSSKADMLVAVSELLEKGWKIISDSEFELVDVRSNDREYSVDMFFPGPKEDKKEEWYQPSLL